MVTVGSPGCRLEPVPLIVVAARCPCSCSTAWTTAAFAMESFTAFGSCLKSSFGPAVVVATSQTTTLHILCSTSPCAPGCPVVAAASADGGNTHPFLFTHGQVCLNRTFFSCRHTPSVRSTWSAAVVVPSAFTAVKPLCLLPSTSRSSRLPPAPQCRILFARVAGGCRLPMKPLQELDCRCRWPRRPDKPRMQNVTKCSDIPSRNRHNIMMPTGSARQRSFSAMAKRDRFA